MSFLCLHDGTDISFSFVIVNQLHASREKDAVLQSSGSVDLFQDEHLK